MTALNQFLLGAIFLGYAVLTLFFLRFYRDTRDSLFIWFAAAFFVMSISRIIQAMLSNPAEGAPSIYLVRAFGFALILFGIIHKNYVSRRVQRAQIVNQDLTTAG